MEEKTHFLHRAVRHFSAGALSGMTVLYGNQSATVRGCRRILFYSPERIRLALGEREIDLCGRGLRCVSFAGGTVCVEGTVEMVTLSETGKNP